MGVIAAGWSSEPVQFVDWQTVCIGAFILGDCSSNQANTPDSLFLSLSLFLMTIKFLMQGKQSKPRIIS